MLRALRFDEGLPLGGDYDLALRLAATAAGCAVDEVLAEIRLHDERTTARRGYIDCYVDKIRAYRREATAGEPRTKRLAQRELARHVAALIGLGVRRGDFRALAGALRRLS